MLINTLPLLEAKDGSEIEGIVATIDQRFQYARSPGQGQDKGDPAIWWTRRSPGARPPYAICMSWPTSACCAKRRSGRRSCSFIQADATARSGQQPVPAVRPKAQPMSSAALVFAEGQRLARVVRGSGRQARRRRTASPSAARPGSSSARLPGTGTGTTAKSNRKLPESPNTRCPLRSTSRNSAE